MSAEQHEANLNLGRNAPKGQRKRRENLVPREQRVALDIPTAADMLSVSRRHVYDLISEGRIKSTKIGNRRLIARRELERLLDEGAA